MRFRCASLIAGVIFAPSTAQADPNGKISSLSQLAVTRDGSPSRPRIWSLSNQGQLMSFHEGTGFPQWHAHPISSLQPFSAVAAVYWVQSGFYQRAYTLSSEGELVTYQEDDTASQSIVSYLDVSQFGGGWDLGRFYRNVTAMVLGDTNRTRVVGVKFQPSGETDSRLAVLWGAGPGGQTPDSYNNAVISDATKKVRHGPLVSAQMTPSRYAVFGLNNTGASLVTYLSENGSFTLQSLPLLATNTHPLAATSYRYNEDDYAAVVYLSSTSSSIWLGLWKNSFLESNSWGTIGLPPGGVKNEPQTVSIQAHLNGLEVAVISIDGKLYSKQLSFLGVATSDWQLRAAPEDVIGGLRSVVLAPEPAPRYPALPPPGISLTNAVFTGSTSEADMSSPIPSGYVFEQRSSDALVRNNTSRRRLRNHVDQGVHGEIINPLVTIDNVRTRRPWTESALAENKGTMLVGAMVPPDLRNPQQVTDPMHIEAAYSIDDGHSWQSLSVPKVFSPSAQVGITQGDPTTAVLSRGDSYLMAHEVLTNPGCPTDGPIISESYIYVYKRSGNSMVIDSALDKVSSNPWYDKAPADQMNSPVYYLDHPQIANTKDDTLHFTWLRTFYNGEIPTGDYDRSKIYYRNRLHGSTYSNPIVIAQLNNGGDGGDPNNDAPGFELGPPYIFTDRGDNVYIWWVTELGGRLWLCNVKNSVDGYSCRLSPVSGHPNVQTCVQPVSPVAGRSIRSGKAYMTAGASAGHIAATWLACRQGIGTPTCFCQGDYRNLVVFTQSFDGGTTWTPIEIVSTLDNDLDTEQFDPTMFIQKDGGIVISYWSNNGTPAPRFAKRVVAIKEPGSTEWFHGERDVGFTDVSLLPDRCNSTPGYAFEGDYHLSSGGETRGHFLWSQATSVNGNAETQCKAATLSWSTWR